MKSSGFKRIGSGSVTSPKGFLAGAVCAKIKPWDKLDIGILFSEALCSAAGVFTTNKIKAAPVLLSQRNLANRKAQAIVVNSGCANACTGERGLVDAIEMAALTARRLGISAGDVLVGSTGVIGVPLPMKKISAGIQEIVLSREGGHELAKAMMTTDTFPKEVAFSVEGAGFTVGGVAKGSGMIHPELATMLCFLTTDALVDVDFLQMALHKAVNLSFNMITVDGETSPSDLVFLLANGLAGNKVIKARNGEIFQEALNEVCLYLAKSIARDGEGATKLIEVNISGAITEKEARLGARTIAASPLVKAAVYGGDPNWGRIIAALGRSGIRLEEKAIDFYINNYCIMQSGHPIIVDKEALKAAFDAKEVLIRLHLNLGKWSATAWGCDLSEEYVTINSSYTT